MNEVKIARQWIKGFLKNNPDPKNTRYGKINNIIYGFKNKNGESTGEMAIKFYVDKKLPLNQIKEENKIPSFLVVRNLQFLTDVEDVNLNVKALTFCFDPDGSTEPVKSNQRRTRPLIGGSSSIGTFPLRTDATLGIFARDLTDGAIVAVSNNHVYVDAMLYPGQARPDFFAFEKTNIFLISATQPGSSYYNVYATTISGDLIGPVKRAVPYNIASTENYVDVAIVSLTGYDLIDPLSSGRIINFNVDPPFKWATEDEIDSLIDPNSINYGAPLFKSGRTSGPLGNPGSLYNCQFDCTETDCYSLCAIGIYNGYIGFDDVFESYNIWFTDTILYQSVNKNFPVSLPGDSGSAVFALMSSISASLSAWKFVGLNFAGNESTDSNLGVFCRADYIKQQIEIGPWDTSLPELSSRLDQVQTQYPYTTDLYITLSGRKYYVFGKEIEPNQF